jgi:hypothetical protein
VVSTRHTCRLSRGNPMRGKQIALTAVIALVVVVGFNAYQARKG